MSIKRILVMGAACALMTACGGGGDDEAPPPAPPPPAPPPSAMVTVTGAVQSEAGEPLGGYDIMFAGPDTLSKTTEHGTGEFSLELTTGDYTATVMTGDFEAGVFTVSINDAGAISSLTNNVFMVAVPADAIGGELDSDSDVPPLSVSSTLLDAGATIDVLVNLAGGQSLSNFQATGAGCGTISDQLDLSSGTVSAVVGEAGVCVLSADLDQGGNSSGITTQFTVRPAIAALSGLSVPDAVFDAAATLQSGNGGANVSSLAFSGSIVNGGQANAIIAVDPNYIGTDIVTAAVAVNGFDGVFFVPVEVINGQVTVPLAVDQNFFSAQTNRAFSGGVGGYRSTALAADMAAKSTGQPTSKQTHQALNARMGFGQASARNAISDTLNVIVQLITSDGLAGEPQGGDVAIQEVGGGELQISVSWDTPTDVDLHVVEPSGQEIYFGRTVSSSGGRLDLDSNPACRIDGVNSENVSWANATDIPVGEYTVRVNYWANCGGQSANYVVSINNCGETTVFEGSFDPGDASGGGAGSGREITTFSYSACSGYRAAGQATYEDLAPSTSGFANQPTDKAIRFAKVSVRTVADDQVLAEGETDAAGKFDIDFQNPQQEAWFVRVDAQQGNAQGLQRVVNASNQIYSQRSEEYDGAADMEVLDIAISAPQNEAGPAFNIFDVGVDGFALSKRYYNTLPTEELTWRWPSSGGGSSYTPSQHRINVAGNAAQDEDQYDDTNLLHEFGHYFIDELSISDTPGGSHSLTQRLAPRFAFNEGMATVVGNAAVNSPIYIDVKPTRTFHYSIETLPSNVPMGTDTDGNGGQNDVVAEAVISAVGWDLWDSTPREGAVDQNDGLDTISNRSAVFLALRELRQTTGNRGASGIDLVDYLDRWSCVGGQTGGTPQAGFRALVETLNGFPYDSNPTLTQENCNGGN